MRFHGAGLMLIVGLTLMLIIGGVSLLILGAPQRLLVRLSTATQTPAALAPTIEPTGQSRAPVLADAQQLASPTRVAFVTPTATATPTLTTAQAIASASLPARDPLDLAQRLRGISEPLPRIVHATPPAYSLGDTEIFWVADSRMATHFTVTATLRYITPVLYMWVEEGYPVSQDDLIRSAERFTNEIYPTNRRLFGSEWTPGVDSDPRISIFNGRVPGVAGYFYSPNQYSQQVHPFSNEREMFFINLDVRGPGTDEYDATLAHEFQHMIHWHKDRNEDAWVNEGLSKLAEQVNGFSVLPYAQAYLRQPDVQLTTWPTAGEPTIGHYGASYLFLAYFMEQYGDEAVRMLVSCPLNGPSGFDWVLSELKADRDFDALFRDWVIANYLDEPGIEGGRFGYSELTLETPGLLNQHDSFPASATGLVRQYGVHYVGLSGETRGPLEIRFWGEPESQLADMTPRSGGWSWWSNRGDYSNATLTRSFDLHGVDEATLSLWMWYDIEPDWDYAYIVASGDEGETWEVLAGNHTVTTNPNGNSFGPAYTGIGGSGTRPQWIREDVDLTAYAGGPITIRFKLVTDDAVNHVGLFIDDVSISEIGYFDDMEWDDGGWVSAGFVRTDNILPQRYLVQLMEIPLQGQPAIRLMELDANQHGRLTLTGLGHGIQEAVLAISALAPATTGPARFGYEILPVE